MFELTSYIGTGSVLALALFGVVFLIRRGLPFVRTRYQTRGELQQLDVLALTPQCSVALVQADQDVLVLGLTAQSVILLTRTPAKAVPQPSSPDARERPTAGRRLRLVQGRRGQRPALIPPLAD